MNINAIIADLTQRIAQNRAYVETVLADAKRAGRQNLTLSEDAECERRLNAIDTDKAALERARKVEREESEIDAAMRESHPAPGPVSRTNRAYDQVARITSEPRTYNRGNDPSGTNFLADVARAQLAGDAEAYTRLARHSQEERIERAGSYSERTAGDLVTGSSGAGIGGICVPQYLVEMTAPAVAARRPLADNMTPHTLPNTGMTFTIPVVTTSTSVANQANQLDAVSATSLNETDLTLSVYTAAGQQTVSRQAVDRSSIDTFVVSDLLTRYATNLDSQLINMSTYGLSAKASSTLGAYADTQPTGAKLYPKILAAASGVEAVLMGTNADLAVMHSRRWYWLSKEMTTSWPLINSQGVPTQAAGVNANANYGGVRGVLPNGMRVVVDNNCSTTVTVNQDEIYLVPSAEAHLFEEPNSPVYIRAEQPSAAKLAVLYVCWGYYGFTFDRYGAGSMQKCAGTGLTTPTF